VFLANGSPRVQMRVLEQLPRPKLVVADTMDLWINIERPALLELWQKIDGVVLNDSEAKLLTGDENLVRAGRRVLELGPKFAIIKKGEHGAMFFSRDETYVMPAYPTSRVIDPTGAGDCFAGGLMGHLSQRGNCDAPTLKHSLAYGTIVASYCVEDFSLDRLQQVERADIDRRLDEYRRMLAF
jgi:sugar/nucleoside kinase (ribokinase family)